MKKITMILALMIASYCTFAQTTTTKASKTNYRVGLVTTVPVDVYGEDYHVGLASTLFEVSYKICPKATLTLNSGYVRMSAESKPTYAQIPVLVGVRYPLSNTFYIGAAGGVSFYNKSEFGKSNFMYEPYIGFQQKHISVDLNYFNTVKNDAGTKTLAITVSYTL